MTELILKKSIEELTPALISFNNEELMSYASQIVEKYSKITYNDDQMKEAKEDRANIRKVIDALTSERIRIKKIYNVPMDKFTSQMNEVISLLEEGLKNADEQIKAKEKADKDAKNALLKGYFAEIIGDLKECITYEQIADSRWLNSTVTEKKAKAEMDAKLEEINEAVEVIRQLESDNEAALLALYFRTLNLAKALQENERLNMEREKALVLQRKREALAMPQKQAEDLAPKEENNLQAGTFTVILEVTGTPESMKGLLDYIKANKIACKAIKKE